MTTTTTERAYLVGTRERSVRFGEALLITGVAFAETTDGDMQPVFVTTIADGSVATVPFVETVDGHCVADFYDVVPESLVRRRGLPHAS